MDAVLAAGGASPRRGARSEAARFAPLVVFPRGRGREPAALALELRHTAERYLPRLGAMLLRGFGLGEDAALARFRAALVEPAGSRLQRAWLWCVASPEAEGVELVDCAELARRLPARLRERWSERGLEQQRRFEPAALRAWLQAAAAPGPERLSAFCRRHALRCEWEPRGGVRLSRRHAPLARHPVTGEPVWCAPAFAVPLPFESSSEAPGAGWQLRHADGSPLEPLECCELSAAIEACRMPLALEPGDLLWLDPARMAHALPAGAQHAVLALSEPAHDAD